MFNVDPEAVKLIFQLGFPAFMCIWFMLRTEKIIIANTDVTIAVKNFLEQLTKR